MKEVVKIKASRYAKSLWNEWILQPVDCKYNLGFVSQICGDLDIPRLKNALLCYINQNPLIRSSFLEENEILFQVIHPALKDPVDYYDYSGKDQSILDKLFQKLRRQSFNLDKAPLFNFSIIKAGENNFYLFLIFHHSIIDGTSALGVTEEISRYYNNKEVPLPENVVFKTPLLDGYLEYEEKYFREHSVAT